MPRKLTPVVFGEARFTVYSAGCVRMEFARGRRFSPFPSLLMGDTLPKPQAADVEITRDRLRVRTERFELTYVRSEDGFTAENLRIVHRNSGGGREVWVPGKKDTGNLGTVRRCLDQWDWCGGPEHYPVEGILSTQGGHFLADEARVYWNTRYEWPEDLSHRVAFDGYFFAYGNDYKAALRDFIAVFGRIPMIPRWALGFWYSRWHAYTDRELLALARRYRREGIPLDVMVIDTDWRQGWGGYDWNRKLFPNPRAALRALRREGLHVTLNDHPGYDAYERLPDGDSHIPIVERRLGPLPHQGGWACDWSNAHAVRVWREHILGPFFDLGMDFWWVDGWAKPAFGSSDSQLWLNRQYYELAEKRTQKRGLILSRWGGVGSHRYPVQFSGDTPSDWRVLKHEIEMTARSAGLGAVYWSHDIGGFFAQKLDDELFIRWVQFGSLSPIFRTHSAHGIREPWAYSALARAVFRKQTRMRYALLPYLYTLVWEAHEAGLPLVRPLFLEYNQGDGGALNLKHQYLLGRDLLVIPADGPVEQATGLFRKRAYFPPGRWLAVETDEVVEGSLACTLSIPRERIPVYVREGAILPCAPVAECVARCRKDVLFFDFYPSRSAPSSFTLYEDDGETLEYRRGRYALLPLEGRREGRTIAFRVGAPQGTYRGMPTARVYAINVRLEPGERPARAEVRIGRGPWRTAPWRMVPRALADEVRTGHRFCRVRVRAANEPVEVRVFLE